VSNSASIYVATLENYFWIQVNGKGNVFISPTLKDFTDSLFKNCDNSGELPQLTDTPSAIVLDLKNCCSMDSTFMGMIAGLAIKINNTPKSLFYLCNVEKKNRSSLEELGLDCIVDINNPSIPWTTLEEKVVNKLQIWDSDKASSPNSQLIFETHSTLGSLSTTNKEKFADVIKISKDEL